MICTHLERLYGLLRPLAVLLVDVVDPVQHLRGHVPDGARTGVGVPHVAAVVTVKKVLW